MLRRPTQYFPGPGGVASTNRDIRRSKQGIVGYDMFPPIKAEAGKGKGGEFL